MPKQVTWVIGSTGSNTNGTHISPEIEAYLVSKNFEKSFRGNPTFTTNEPYSLEEMQAFANNVLEIRNSNGKSEKNIVKFWRASEEYTVEND